VADDRSSTKLLSRGYYRPWGVPAQAALTFLRPVTRRWVLRRRRHKSGNCFWTTERDIVFGPVNNAVVIRRVWTTTARLGKPRAGRRMMPGRIA
jgi:hypothetical protein